MSLTPSPQEVEYALIRFKQYVKEEIEARGTTHMHHHYQEGRRWGASQMLILLGYEDAMLETAREVEESARTAKDG